MEQERTETSFERRERPVEGREEGTARLSDFRHYYIRGVPRTHKKKRGGMGLPGGGVCEKRISCGTLTDKTER